MSKDAFSVAAPNLFAPSNFLEVCQRVVAYFRLLNILHPEAALELLQIVLNFFTHFPLSVAFCIALLGIEH